MLQLSKNKANNTIAIYPEVAPTGSALGIRLSGSQDYDRNPSVIGGSLITGSESSPWVIAALTSSMIPDASGLYTYEVYDLYSLGNALIWDQTTTEWQLETALWNQGGLIPNQLLTTVRAYVSGADVPVFTQYESPDENGAYTTYLG